MLTVAPGLMIVLPSVFIPGDCPLLLIDFFLSPEGQKMLIETFKHGSPVRDYGFKRWYPEEGFTTSQYDEAMNRWQKLVSEFARR